MSPGLISPPTSGGPVVPGPPIPPDPGNYPPAVVRLGLEAVFDMRANPPGPATAPTKVPGVATLPSGMTLSGNEVSGSTSATFDGWLFNGKNVRLNGNATYVVRNSVFATDPTVYVSPIVVNQDDFGTSSILIEDSSVDLWTNAPMHNQGVALAFYNPVVTMNRVTFTRQSGDVCNFGVHNGTYNVSWCYTQSPGQQAYVDIPHPENNAHCEDFNISGGVTNIDHCFLDGEINGNLTRDGTLAGLFLIQARDFDTTVTVSNSILTVGVMKTFYTGQIGGGGHVTTYHFTNCAIQRPVGAGANAFAIFGATGTFSNCWDYDTNLPITG